MRKCHGWLKIQSEMLNGIHSWLAPERINLGMKCSRFMQGGREYTAVVYEYVEEGDNDAAAVQEALDFFWLAGFSATISPLARNWKSSVLVDLSDVVPPRGYAWREEFYKPRDASRVITIGVGLENNNNNNRPVGLRPPPEVLARLQAERYGPAGPPPPRPPQQQLPWAVRDRRDWGGGFPPAEAAPPQGKEKSGPPTEHPTAAKSSEGDAPLTGPSPGSSSSPAPIPGLMPTRLRPRGPPPGRATGSVPSAVARGDRAPGGRGRRGRRRGGAAES